VQINKLKKILLWQILIALFLTIISLLVFLKIGTEIIENEVLSFDSFISSIIYAFREPFITQIMLSITFFGNTLFLSVLSLVFITYLFSKSRKDAYIFSGIFFSAVFVNVFLKLFFERPRPLDVSLIHENTFSFPSGHAMNSFVFYFAIAYFIYRETGNTKYFLTSIAITSLFVLFIGISRVYLGVHYPSDVIAGYIAGFIWLVSAILFDKTIIFERLTSSKK